jgi:hypothetical protein
MLQYNVTAPLESAAMDSAGPFSNRERGNLYLLPAMGYLNWLKVIKV